jgi:hypothetical protein
VKNFKEPAKKTAAAETPKEAKAPKTESKKTVKKETTEVKE